MTFLEEWHLPTAYTYGNCMNTMGLSSWIIDVKKAKHGIEGAKDVSLCCWRNIHRDTHKRWERGTSSCHNMHPSNSEQTLPKISQHASFNSHTLDKSRWIVFLAAFCCWPTHVFSRRQPGPEAMIGKAIERRGIDLRNLVELFSTYTMNTVNVPCFSRHTLTKNIYIHL